MAKCRFISSFLSNTKELVLMESTDPQSAHIARWTRHTGLDKRRFVLSILRHGRILAKPEILF